MKLTKPDVRTLITIVGALSTVVQTAFPGAHWAVALTAATTAVLVHLTA